MPFLFLHLKSFFEDGHLIASGDTAGFRRIDGTALVEEGRDRRSSFATLKKDDVILGCSQLFL